MPSRRNRPRDIWSSEKLVSEQTARHLLTRIENCFASCAFERKSHLASCVHDSWVVRKESTSLEYFLKHDMIQFISKSNIIFKIILFRFPARFSKYPLHVGLWNWVEKYGITNKINQHDHFISFISNINDVLHLFWMSTIFLRVVVVQFFASIKLHRQGTRTVVHFLKSWTTENAISVCNIYMIECFLHNYWRVIIATSIHMSNSFFFAWNEGLPCTRDDHLMKPFLSLKAFFAQMM